MGENRLTAAIGRFFESLIPRSCIYCGEPTNGSLCDGCMKKLANEATRLCDKCGKTMLLCGCMPDALRDVGCEGVTAPFRYSKSVDSVAKALILHLKTHDVKSAFRLIASLASPALGPRYGWLVTYVPRRSRAVMTHGFDQAERLARALADETGCELAVTLKRSGSTVQKELSYDERRVAASKSYETCGERFKGRRIILVDDIITSGATLAECTKLLLENGAEAVHVVTAARSTRN